MRKYENLTQTSLILTDGAKILPFALEICYKS